MDVLSLQTEKVMNKRQAGRGRNYAAQDACKPHSVLFGRLNELTIPQLKIQVKQILRKKKPKMFLFPSPFLIVNLTMLFSLGVCLLTFLEVLFHLCAFCCSRKVKEVTRNTEKYLHLIVYRGIPP